MGKFKRVICLTGGPCAGKTAVTDVIHRQFGQALLVVPESASILYRGGFPRAGNAAEMKEIQKAIFHIQVASEEFCKLQKGKFHGLVCDRGTLDGAAYWPGTQRSFLGAVDSTLEAELKRYSVVIHMESASPSMGYDLTNPLRTESAGQARLLDQKIQKAWSAHPKRFVVTRKRSFIEKIEEVLAILRQELPEAF